MSCCDFSVEKIRKSKRLEKRFKMNLSGERLFKAIIATTVVIQMGILASVCGVRSQRFTVLNKENRHLYTELTLRGSSPLGSTKIFL